MKHSNNQSIHSVIEVKKLGKSFEENTVFKEVNFSVSRGSSYVILGPSGSGKSVLLKILAGLLTPDQGRITIASENLGMLFQKNALFDSLSVLENLLMPLKERAGLVGPEAEKKSLKMLEQVGLSHATELFPSEISGGMQKRLGIARALILDPEVMLYDEPTAGLDPITSRKIADLIRERQKTSGTTIVCVTNDVNRAYQLGDTIALLARGTLREGGTPEQVRSTQDPELRQFVKGLKQGPLTEAFT